MKPDEKTEDDLAAESDRLESAANESAVLGLDEAEEGRPYPVPDAEERGGSDEESIPELVMKEIQEGDLVLTLGAGSVTALSDRLAETVRDRVR